MRRKNLHIQGLLFLAITFCLVLLASPDASAARVDSIIAGHGSCDQCHGRFSGAAGNDTKKGQPAAIQADQVDLLCLGCHGPAGISLLKADTHGAQNYVIAPISCIDCHDPHDNTPNYVNGHNIKLIGSDKNSRFATITTPNSGKRQVVFESLGTDTSESALYSFADGDLDNDGKYSGICEVCHTRTKYHRNTEKGNHDHYTGQTCTNCHVHVNQFLAFGDNTLNDEPEITGIIIDESGNTWEGITLFLDINGNGRYDEGEPTATTDADGNFAFKGIANKGYNILLMPGSLPNGYTVKISMSNNAVLVTLLAEDMRYPTRVVWQANSNGYMVTDHMRDAVYFYDNGGKLTGLLEGMDKPLGLATDLAGRIFVGNVGKRNIQVYDAAGNLTQIFAQGQLKQPNDIVLDRQQRVYVVDSQSKNVRVFKSNGRNDFTITTGKNNDSFHFPNALAINYRMDGGVEVGELYVADKTTCLIHVYDLQGNYLRSLGGKYQSSGGGMGMGGFGGGTYGVENIDTTGTGFNSIQSIAFDQHGRLHVLDNYMSTVTILDPLDGTALGSYNVFKTGQGSQQSLDIDISATGQVLMTSFKTRTVQPIYTVQ